MTTKLPPSLLTNGTPNTILRINASGRVVESAYTAGTNTGQLTYVDDNTFTVAGGPIGSSTLTVLLPTITKTMAAVFSQGMGNGCMDVIKSANSSYHVFVIQKNTTLDGDIFCSANLVPTPPAGWSIVKRIGSLHTDSSNRIRPFFQAKNKFMFAALPGVGKSPFYPHSSISRSNTGGAAEFTFNAYGVPNGVPVTMFLHFNARTSWAREKINYIRIPGGAAETPNTASGSVLGVLNAYNVAPVSGYGVSAMCSSLFEVYNPSSNQFIVNHQCIYDGGTPGGTPRSHVFIQTMGYIDHSI